MSLTAEQPGHEGSDHAAIVAELQSRWPENRVAPSLARVQALCDLLGDPQRCAPVIQIAGTNGKGSTALMIDALARATGLRTGRFASPHLEDICERICVDGEPISPQRFDQAWLEIKPYVEMVDVQQLDGVPMTFFEVMTVMAYAIFADAPVDVMIIECGMGGRWDATSVADADVAVICPIDYDHQQYLGDTLDKIAAEKAGIIKEGTIPVLAGQDPQAATVLLRRCAEVGVSPLREGPDFSVLERTRGVGGQVLRLHTSTSVMSDLVLPLHGEHMAHNAAVAVVALEALLGSRPIDPEVIATGLAAVKAPARTELIYREPAVVLDTCHNPHGACATMATITEAFAFEPCIGVVSMMADKNVEETLRVFAETMSIMIVTKTSWSPRAMAVGELAEIASDICGAARVYSAETMAEAITMAMAHADVLGDSAGVVIAGSVIGAGEARSIIKAMAHSDIA